MAGGDVQRVRACFGRPDRDLPALLERQSAGEEVLDRQPIDDRHAGYCRLDRAQRFESEARPVLQAAAVVVGAPVLERGVKLRDEVAVRRVNLDAIEARLARTRRGGGVRGDRRVDARLGHLLRHDGLERRLVDRMRDRRRRNRRLAANVDAGVATAVAELDRHLRSGAVNFIDEARQPRQKAVVVDADLAPAMAPGLFRRCHLDGDEADAAARPRQIIGDAVVGDVALRVRRARRHRRHDDAVGDFDRTDARRGEQDVHGILSGYGGGEWSGVTSQHGNFAAVEIDGGTVQPGGPR